LIRGYSGAVIVGFLFQLIGHGGKHFNDCSVGQRFLLIGLE
jgi:hypothetical protein